MDLETAPQKMTAAADALDQAARGIDTVLETLEAATQRLAGEWQGDAREAFFARYGTLAADLRAQVGTLRAATATMSALATEYSTADTKGAAAVPH